MQTKRSVPVCPEQHGLIPFISKCLSAASNSYLATVRGALFDLDAETALFRDLDAQATRQTTDSCLRERERSGHTRYEPLAFKLWPRPAGALHIFVLWEKTTKLPGTVTQVLIFQYFKVFRNLNLHRHFQEADDDVNRSICNQTRSSLMKGNRLPL